MSRAKAKGTKYESSLVKVLNDWSGGQVAERVVLHGNYDNGDLRLTVDDLTICVEAKWRKSYPSEGDMLDFRAQTLAETGNSGADGGILVVNHYNQSVMRSEVWMCGGTWLALNAVAGKLPGHTHDEHDWLCMTLLDFCWMCFGAPAWGMEELN